MGLPVDLPGLDALVSDVPDGHVVLVEGGMDPAKSFFAEYVARRAAESGRAILFVTSRERESTVARMTARQPLPENVKVVALERWEDVGLPAVGDRDIIVDAFSFFLIGLHAKEVARHLRELRGYCQRSGKAAVLVGERGMLPNDADVVLNHLTDGLLQFHVREGSEGLQQFLRIPKWTQGEVFTNNVYYSFDGERLLIDTRRRLT